MKNLLRNVLLGTLSLFLLTFVLAISTLGFAQTSVGGYGVQTLEATNGEVALDTLNIHLDIPLVSKSGVGLPVYLSLGYNSNGWYPGSTWNLSHAPYQLANVPFWHLPSLSGYFVYQPINCQDIPGQPPIPGHLYTLYVDNSGTSHVIGKGSGAYISKSTTTDICLTNSDTELFSDGSGITVNLIYGGGTATLPSGIKFSPSGVGDGPVSDVNGNTISPSFAPQGYIDTLGVQEVTITGTPTSGPVTYAYPTATGTADVKVYFTNKTLATSFGCSNITEFPATSGYYLPTSIALPDGSSYSFTYESQVAGTVTGRIKSITYPSGEVVSYQYTGPNNGINCADGSTSGLKRTVAGDAAYQYSRNTSTWLTTTLVNDYGTGHSNNTNVYTFVQQPPLPYPLTGPGAMFLTQEIVNQGSSTPLVTKVFCYNTVNPVQANCPTATAPTFPITQKDVFTTLGGMSTSSRVSTTFDGYMNATKTAVYDFGATTPTRQIVPGPYGYTWNGSTTSPNCNAAIGSGVNDRPCQVQLQNGSGAQLRNSYFAYDPKGNLLSKAVLTSGSTYLTTSTTYNSNGTVATSTDANLNKTTLTYEMCNTISNALLTKVVPPISTLDTQYSWDSNCQGARMMSATDPNGFSVTTTYNDPFWRSTSKTDQLTNTVNLSYYPTVPINTSEAQMTFGSSDYDVFNTADALGRPLYAQRIETSGGSWDTIQMGYSWNTTGRVTTKTMPCVAAKGSGCSNGTTTVTHDALGRSSVTTDGGGGALTATYTGHSSGCGNSLLGCVDVLVVLGPAPAGEVVKQVQKEYNGLGQVRSVCQLSSAAGTTSCGQANGGTGYLTTYNYNADGTASSIVRGAQTHSFTYDALGRTLTATYPESGTKQFFYDTAPSTPGVACSGLPLLTNTSPLGHLLKTYDANGTTTCYAYDSMNRVNSIAYSGANSDGENKYFVYDSATVNSVVMVNTLGRIAEAYTAPNAVGTKVTDEGFSYTARGEVSDVYQWSTNSNGWYHTSATYFANGVVNTLSGVPGASGSPWTYSLDGKGRPYSAIQGASTNMVSSVTYNTADEPLVTTLGLGDTDTYVYDNGGLLSTGRMTSYTFSIGAAPTTFAGNLTWNANGSLRGLATVDGINSGSETETCAYGTSTSPGYDEFGRLLQVNCVNGTTNVWNQTFAYDIYDNVTKSVPTGGTGTAWAPGYNATNNRYTLSGATYDSDGNLLADTFHTYSWNQDNHPKAMTDAGITMIYDAFGRMVEKVAGSTYQQTLISPVGPVALMSQQNLTQFRMPLPGGDTAITGGNFYHRDYLGSVPLISSRVGRASIAARLFAPYGESYNSVGITGNVTFTGDNQDLVAGTFDTPNRELNPTQGRWISPDPSHAGWNAYSYTTNPLGAIDPSGLRATEYIPCGCGSFGNGNGVFISNGDGGGSLGDWGGDLFGDSTWSNSPGGSNAVVGYQYAGNPSPGLWSMISAWAPATNNSAQNESSNTEQGTMPQGISYGSSGGYAFPLSVARGGYKWYKFIAKWFDKGMEAKKLGDEIDADEAILNIVFMSITANPTGFPGQFIQIYQLERINIDVYDKGRLTGKLMAEVPSPPGADSFGDTVFDYYGQLRDANNGQIDELLQEAAAANAH